MTSSLDWLVTRQIQHAGSRFGVCETAAPHVVISRELVADDPVKSGEWTGAQRALRPRRDAADRHVARGKMTAQNAMSGALRGGTLASVLARVQARFLGATLARLTETRLPNEIVIGTHGNRDATTPLPTLGGRGVVTEAAGCARRVHRAQHSIEHGAALRLRGAAPGSQPSRVGRSRRGSLDSGVSEPQRATASTMARARHRRTPRATGHVRRAMSQSFPSDSCRIIWK